MCDAERQLEEFFVSLRIPLPREGLGLDRRILAISHPRPSRTETIHISFAM